MGYVNSLYRNVNYEFIKNNIYAATTEVINNPQGSLAAVGKVSLNIFKSYALYSLYEASLSDIFCLKTFRHGTDPSACLKIHLTGPDLNRGGTGGEARWYEIRQMNSPYAHRDKGRFYVVQDYFERNSRKETALSYIANKITLKYYALRSTVSYYGSWMPLPKSWKASITSSVVNTIETEGRARILGMICPSVKIHLDPDCISYPDQSYTPSENIKHTFSPDSYDSNYLKDFSGACYTEDPLSVFDIGICGILKNGLNTRLPHRVWHHKGQFLWGVAQLVATVALTAFFFPTLIPHGHTIGAVIQHIVDSCSSNTVSITNIGKQIISGFSTIFIFVQF